jgi:diguanylate cyclase (GGDEF)-like protein
MPAISPSNAGSCDATQADVVQTDAAQLEAAPFEPRGEIERLLGLRLRDLKLPPHIKALYAAKTRKSARKMMSSWCVGVIVLNLVTGLFDALPRPFFQFDIGVRIALSLGFLLSAFLLRSGRLIGREHVAIILPMLCMVVAAGVVGTVSNDTTMLDRLLPMTLVAVYTGLMFVRIDIAYLVFLAAASVGVMAAFIIACGGNDVYEKAQIVIFYSLTTAAVLYARRTHDLYHYQLFLLKLKEEFRVSDVKTENLLLATYAYVDTLTRIPNRRHFDEVRAEMERAATPPLPISFALLDIDNFKILNDRLGHLQGDQCLHGVAQAIEATIASKDVTLARYGGEEFVLVFPNTGLEAAVAAVEQIRAAILDLRQPNPGSPTGFVTVSAGVATADTAPFDGQDLIRTADRALYRAKSSGRNRTRA